MKLISETQKYRPDIDGLRALAVISVILFHLDKNILSGGFVGVDIFFVISGFLITKIIYNEMLLGRFTFLEFYKRRIKRIAPAFFACLIVTMIIGLTIVVKNDMKPLVRSVISSIFSVANIYFYNNLKTGYFENNSEETPLLHMWSLGVEEQFYIFWPLTLVMLIKTSRKWLLTILFAAIVASFGYAEVKLSTNAKFAYYMITTRSGEMFLGAALAIFIHHNHTKHVTKFVCEMVSVVGLALICWSIVYTDRSHFPGISAFWPCIGTVMIIYAGSYYSDCTVQKLFSAKPVVFVGLISYSLYLWHWPLISYANYLYFSEWQHKIVVVGLTIIFSLISYYFIEVPIRRSNMSVRMVYITLYIIPVPAVILTVIAYSFFSPKVRNYVAPDPVGVDKAWHTRLDDPQLAPTEEYSHYCFSGGKPPTVDLMRAESCINGSSHSTEPNVLFFGDSHAMHYVNFLDILGKKYNFSFRAISRISCPAIFSEVADYGSDAKDKRECLEFRNMIKGDISKYRYVILGGFWASESYPKTLFSDLNQTIGWLLDHNVKVIVMGSVPLFKDYKARCRGNRVDLKFVNCTDNNIATGYDISKMMPVNDQLKKIVSKYKGAYYLDAMDVLCSNGFCSPYVNNELVYLDTHHLTLKGSRIVGEEFTKKGYVLPDVFQEIIKSQK